MPHFLDIDKLAYEDLSYIIELANKLKSDLKSGNYNKPLQDKQLAMIFEKPSTRTRASFEVGINQLGGSAITLNTGDSQLSRGEPISDTAQVLSRYADLIMIRCFKHESLVQLAEHATCPVINGLTDYSHPCQIMADIMTFEEHRGSIKGKKVAWLGEDNNVTHSWIHAAKQFNFELVIATPESLKPPAEFDAFDSNISWTSDPKIAAKDADILTTDTWFSMGDEESSEKHDILRPYQINNEIMKLAKGDAIFLHCLPAHRGEEVSEEVIDGDQSKVFDQAENRLHIQKAIMIWCLR